MRVLVFDDEVDVLYLYKLILTKQGHDVYTFQNCHNVLDVVAAVRPDVIFMDNSMPGVTGFEATRQIKKSKHFSDIHIIYCSANSDAAELARDANADKFLPKPFSIQQLNNSLQDITIK